MLPSCGEITKIKFPVKTLSDLNKTFTAGSPHKALVGGYDDRHCHLQTRGVLLLSAPHLDQSHKVQVMKFDVVWPRRVFCRVH